MAKKYNWKDRPDLPEGLGMVQAHMPGGMHNIIEVRDNMRVWTLLIDDQETGPDRLVFRTGMQALAMLSVVSKRERMVISDPVGPDVWMVSSAKGKPLGILMRDVILDPDGVADYDKETPAP